MSLQTGYHFLGDLRHELFAVKHQGFSRTFPSTSTVSTMPTIKASTGAPLVAGVKRAELPWVNKTHCPWPAPIKSTATTELPEGTSAPSRVMYGCTSISFMP